MKRSAILRKPDPTARASVPVFKPRACKVCKSKFTPTRGFVSWCSPECGFELSGEKIRKASAKQALADRRETKAKLEKLKPRSKWLAEAQVAFNTWVRKEDEFRGCISCGTNNGKMNAGHYRSVGSCPELRFERLNVHKQCERCNTFFHGNLLGYRAGLRGRISEESLEWLEGPHAPKKYTVTDLQEIIATYRAKTKQLEKS